MLTNPGKGPMGTRRRPAATVAGWAMVFLAAGLAGTLRAEPDAAGRTFESPPPEQGASTPVALGAAHGGSWRDDPEQAEKRRTLLNRRLEKRRDEQAKRRRFLIDRQSGREKRRQDSTMDRLRADRKRQWETYSDKRRDSKIMLHDRQKALRNRTGQSRERTRNRQEEFRRRTPRQKIPLPAFPSFEEPLTESQGNPDPEPSMSPPAHVSGANTPVPVPGRPASLPGHHISGGP